MVTTGHAAREGQSVDVRVFILVQHQAGTVVAAQHQFIVAHLAAERQAHLVGRRSHEEVTVDGAHYLVPRPCVACCHAHRRLASHRFLATQAGLHHDIGVGQVHLDHAHLERQCRYIIFGGNHARPGKVRKDERVHIIGLVADGPLVTGSTRDRPHQQQRQCCPKN